MKTLLLLAFSLLSVLIYAQNHAVGHTTIMFEDPERNNRQIETEIYYPATSAGDDTPAVAGQFPVIVFGHGFVMAWSAYENLWEEFVPRGYIMAFPRTEGNMFSTDHQEFGWDLEFLVTAMQQQGSDQSSVLYDVVASETALMGHSMGGGAAFLAADSLCNNGNQNLKTLVGLAPAESTSNGVSSIASATEVTVPSFILSGVQDGVTPPQDHHIPMYDNLASDCKTILHITGGAHCYFANSNFNCDFGESTSSTGISITRTEQHDITFDFVNLWLDYTLKADCNDFQAFDDSLVNTPRATYDQVCSGPMVFEISETASICDGSAYTFPDGTTSTTSTVHTSTLTSVGGCDSLVETTLTVVLAYQETETATICDGGSYTFPDGTTSSTSTVHTSTLTSVGGCDSLVETTLTVLPAYQETESVTICDGNTYTFPDGTSSSTSTVHTSTLTSVGGCDSLVETTLTVVPAYQETESVTICDGSTYTFPDGTTSSTSTVHTSTLTSVGGCDSIIETTLDVQLVDTNVTLTNGVLTANLTGASYQWIDCNNQIPVNGATSQTYEPSQTGTYAVEITINGCTELSGCHEVQVSGINHSKMLEFEIFPNPTDGNITVIVNEQVIFSLYDSKGKMIRQYELEIGTQQLNLKLSPGVYFWNLNGKDGEVNRGKLVAH